MLFDLLHNTADQVNRDGEANALGARVLRQHRRIDADEFAAAVDQRATGIAGVDRRIGLNEILKVTRLRDCGRWR